MLLHTDAVDQLLEGSYDNDDHAMAIALNDFPPVPLPVTRELDHKHPVQQKWYS